MPYVFWANQKTELFVYCRGVDTHTTFDYSRFSKFVEASGRHFKRSINMLIHQKGRLFNSTIDHINLTTIIIYRRSCIQPSSRSVIFATSVPRPRTGTWYGRSPCPATVVCLCTWWRQRSASRYRTSSSRIWCLARMGTRKLSTSLLR